MDPIISKQICLLGLKKKKLVESLPDWLQSEISQFALEKVQLSQEE